MLTSSLSCHSSDKTFDPDKCGQNNSQRPELDEKIKMWQGRSTVQFVWKTNYTTIINQKKVVDEYGNVNCTAGKVRHVSGKKNPFGHGDYRSGPKT
ncbi:MAG: hypothetical protein R3C12_18710 [Planctomycetaceae bacterium]